MIREEVSGSGGGRFLILMGNILDGPASGSESEASLSSEL